MREHVWPVPSPFSVEPAAVAVAVAAGVSLQCGMQTPPLEAVFFLRLSSQQPLRLRPGVVGEGCCGRRLLPGRLVDQLSRRVPGT